MITFNNCKTGDIIIYVYYNEEKDRVLVDTLEIINKVIAHEGSGMNLKTKVINSQSNGIFSGWEDYFLISELDMEKDSRMLPFSSLILDPTEEKIQHAINLITSRRFKSRNIYRRGKRSKTNIL